jgi:hypothetical protein
MAAPESAVSFLHGLFAARAQRLHRITGMLENSQQFSFAQDDFISAFP